MIPPISHTKGHLLLQGDTFGLEKCGINLSKGNAKEGKTLTNINNM